MEVLTNKVEISPSRMAPPAGMTGKALSWISDIDPRAKKTLAIEFDRNLIKFVLVDARGLQHGVHFLKVKFLSTEREREILKVLQENLLEMEVKRGQHATISIPRHSVHTKILRLPSHDPKELRKMALYQLQKEIPLPIAEIVFDFRVIAREDNGHTRIMAVMARLSEIRRYLELCKEVGLRVDAIRLNIEAIYHALQFIKDFKQLRESRIALVDVDFSATNILMLDRGNLLFCRSVGKGVSDLMDCMVGPERAVVYETWVNRLSDGIQSTIAVFDKSGLNRKVEHVALTGWLPRTKQLCQKLNDDLGVDSKWFDLMTPIRHYSQRQDDYSTRHWFSISTLLGMTAAPGADLMDLRPTEERRSHRKRTTLRQAIYAGLILCYILLLGLGSARLALHRRQEAVATIEHKVASLQPQVDLILQGQKLQNLLEAQIGSTKLTSSFLSKLFGHLPAGIELTSLTFLRNESMVVRGVAGALSDVFNLPPILAQQPEFNEAVIINADRRVQGEEEQVLFEMKINLQKNEK